MIQLIRYTVIVVIRIAGITKPIGISVNLVRVCISGTIVFSIRNAVAVCVGWDISGWFDCRCRRVHSRLRIAVRNRQGHGIYALGGVCMAGRGA